MRELVPAATTGTVELGLALGTEGTASALVATANHDQGKPATAGNFMDVRQYEGDVQDQKQSGDHITGPKKRPTWPLPWLWSANNANRIAAAIGTMYGSNSGVTMFIPSTVPVRKAPKSDNKWVLGV